MKPSAFALSQLALPSNRSSRHVVQSTLECQGRHPRTRLKLIVITLELRIVRTGFHLRILADLDTVRTVFGSSGTQNSLLGTQPGTSCSAVPPPGSTSGPILSADDSDIGLAGHPFIELFAEILGGFPARIEYAVARIDTDLNALESHCPSRTGTGQYLSPRSLLSSQRRLRRLHKAVLLADF